MATTLPAVVETARPPSLNGYDVDTLQGEAKRIRERMVRLIDRLEGLASQRVGRRAAIEQRWILDLEQFHGRYGSAALQEFLDERKSTVFVNITRQKTNAVIARLVDLLFPTEDRNWGIGPTPVPDMTEEAKAAVREIAKHRQAIASATQQGMQAAAMQDQEAMMAAEMAAQQAEGALSEVLAAHRDLDDTLTEARRRATLMAEQIDDQLRGCNYPAAARDAIEDAAKIGVGIIKGPVIGEKMRRKWSDRGENVFDLQHEPDGDPAPTFTRVDPWGFFPDPDAGTCADSDDFLERHLMTRTQLRKLARRPDVDKDAVRALLTGGPKPGELPSYVSVLASVTEQDTAMQTDRFVVWEYTGPLEGDEIVDMALAMGNVDLAEIQSEAEVDPLVEQHVRIWFCQGYILSFEIHPLDSGDPLYSAFSIEKDEASIFGFGIPALLRDEQSIHNAAWRQIMDNSGFSVGPQIVVRKDKITPQNGDWTFKGPKIWVSSEPWGQQSRVFETFHVDSHQAELANILGINRQHVDEVTGMPAIAQGEQGTQVTKTFQGMALLMNSANVLFRRIVKNFDDDITVPVIRRAYDWNMQFSENAAIKGDYEVDARGSSVLLAREIQSQNLMLLAQVFGDHPTWGPMMKKYSTFTEVVRAMSLPPSAILKTESEWESDSASEVDPAVLIEQEKTKQAELAQQVEKDRLDAQVQIANLDAASRRDVAALQKETALIKLAQDSNVKMEDIEARVQMARDALASAERKMAAEVAMKRETGDSAGGSV